MTAAWIAIALIGLGLPLGAWWVGGRPVWVRSDERARRAQEAHREWISRHGLSSAEIAEVQRAIQHGEAIEDPRLSAAAVEAARRQLRAWGAQSNVAQRVQFVLAVLGALMGVVLIIVSVVTGEWSWIYALLFINFLGTTVPQALLRRNLRRTIAVNSRPSAP